MSNAALVLVCALDLLGRSAEQLPPIVVVDTRPPDATHHAAAFVRSGDRTIYLIASSVPFQVALEGPARSGTCGLLDPVRMMASIIVHEEWHLNHGTDEEGAYLAQLMTLQRLGAGPGRGPYDAVQRSMRAVMKAYERRLLVASRDLVP